MSPPQGASSPGGVPRARLRVPDWWTEGPSSAQGPLPTAGPLGCLQLSVPVSMAGVDGFVQMTVSRSLTPGPLTVAQLGDTQPGRDAVHSCSCLPTERRKGALGWSRGVRGCIHCRQEAPQRHRRGPIGCTYWAPPPRVGRQSWGGTGEGLDGDWETASVAVRN